MSCHPPQGGFPPGPPRLPPELGDPPRDRPSWRARFDPLEALALAALWAAVVVMILIVIPAVTGSSPWFVQGRLPRANHSAISL